jgi:5-methylcytosine-specific restriction endonuclease McrA
MSKVNADRIKWWSEKIARYGEKSFGPSVSRWALFVLESLRNGPKNVLEYRSLYTASEKLGVPRKYISRALALLTRSGLVKITPQYPLQVSFNISSIYRYKNSAQKVRGRIPLKDRERLLREDKYKCGHCGVEFSPSELEIDHIVPVSLLGSDEPGNWVALCHEHNRKKWHNFDSHFIRYYRGKPVKGSVGVRFKNGFFWPNINGKTREETRKNWKENL